MRYRGGNRAQRVAELLQQTLGMYIITGQLRDERLDDRPLTVTHVRLSDDLKHAKVFVRMLGEEAVSPETIKALNEQSFRIKREISKNLELRYTPELIFAEDVDFARGQRVAEIIEGLPKASSSGSEVQ